MIYFQAHRLTNVITKESGRLLMTGILEGSLLLFNVPVIEKR